MKNNNFIVMDLSKINIAKSIAKHDYDYSHAVPGSQISMDKSQPCKILHSTCYLQAHREKTALSNGILLIMVEAP